jgi:t-SNARE complex subunit (syntaxin)
MNKTRRKKIKKLLEDLEEVVAEEREAFENLPENIQLSDKGEEMEDDIISMDDAIEEIRQVITKE